MRAKSFTLKFKKERDKAVEKARREAQGILDDARRTANQVSEELKQLRKQMRDAADAQGINQRQADLRRNLHEAEERLAAHHQPVERPKPTRAIQLGDTVELLKLGTKASVIAIQKDGTYTLQAGILKMTVKPEEVYLLEDANQFQVKRSGLRTRAGNENCRHVQRDRSARHGRHRSDLCVGPVFG